MRTVSVICPCRNEARFIDDFIASLLAQEREDFELEVIVADGRSDDGTAEKLRDWSVRQPMIRMIDNPMRIVSTGLNRALREARGDIIVRMDIHTVYAGDYVRQCVAALETTGATCVGGAWRAQGRTPRQKAIAWAFQSRFGSGGAASRRVAYSGPVDTVYLGAWRRADLLALGGFDEDLVRNQDDELCLRIHRAGGRVWQSAAIRSTYFPRDSLSAVLKQFYQYGYWKALVLKKHKLPASPRHLAPFGFFSLLLMLAALAPFHAAAAAALAALAAAYVFCTALCACAATREPRLSLFAACLLAFWAMHAGYGAGFGHGLFDFIVTRHGMRDGMARLTR